jgi:hypothetical protein
MKNQLLPLAHHAQAVFAPRFPQLQPLRKDLSQYPRI